MEATLTAYVAQNPGFPYKRLVVADPDTFIAECLMNLSKAIKTFTPTPTQPVYHGHPAPGMIYVHINCADKRKFGRNFPTNNALMCTFTDDDYELYMKFSDMIPGCEEARMATRVDGMESPLEMWAKPAFKAAIIQFACKNWSIAEHPIAYVLRESIYANVKEAAQFGAHKAAAIYAHYQPRTILDPCSGWGDRALGALAWGLSLGEPVVYYGFDPNLALTPTYQYIQNLVVAKTTINITQLPFEEGVFAKKRGSEETPMVDLVFTSPPYFDKEVYSKDGTQSVSRYPTADAWFKNFLFVLLDTAWAALKVGGHMVIHIGDTRNLALVERTVRGSLERLPGCRWDRIMLFRSIKTNGNSYYAPMWCFKKVA